MLQRTDGRPARRRFAGARGAALGLAACLVGLTAPAFGAGTGEKMYKEFVETQQIYADEAWQGYVRAIGERLLEETPDAGRDYKFVVLDNSQINAFATGDAYIFVNRGLIAFLRSEDELAAVIGHEIGHVVGRHVQRRRGTEVFGKSVGLVAAVLTGRGELMDVSNTALATMVSGYGREMELEADRYGGEFIARAGYNPLAIIDVVQVLKDQELFSKQVANRPANYHGLFATHPKNDKRLHDAVAYAQGMLPEEIVDPIGDFWEMVDGLVYGDEAAAGLVRDNAFFHTGLRFVIEFPEGWPVSNTKSQVVGRDPAGDDVAFITLARHEYQKRTSPEKYVTKVLQRDDVTAGESLEINGFEAYVGELDLEGSAKKLAMIGVLYKGNDVFLFKGEAGPNGDAETFRDHFLQTMHGLRGMTAADAQFANNQRIAVIVAEPGMKYRDLALETSIKQYPEQTLRLLNAGHPHGEPRPGDYVKIPR